MDAIELLTTRRSCAPKAMIGPGPTPDELHTILEAGIRVPDHGKLHPWRIQILTDRGRSDLGRLCRELFAADNPDASDEQLTTEATRFERGATVLVVSNEVGPHPKIPEVEQMLSGGAVCQNLLHASHALGYVACWLTEWPTYRSEVRHHLGVQAQHAIIGFIYIGSCAESSVERKRAAVSEVVSMWDGRGTELTYNPPAEDLSLE